MTDTQKSALDENGYVLLDGFIDPSLLAGLRDRLQALLDREGDHAGAEFRREPNAHRLANLVNKGEVFEHAIALPALLDAVRHVLGPDIKLSSLNARSADPHSQDGQPLHVDMAAVPDDRGYWVCNTIWLIDDFTPDNGATRLIPGSHRWGTRPQDALADPMAPHPDEVLLLGRAGSVAIMNSHLWHGGTANRTDRPRMAMHAFFCRRDKPQQQYQRTLLSADVQARLSPELRDLLALDDVENDRLSAAPVERSGFMK
jgi:ectoine hydroxylase-related dioxygenase (phytanoyl-CoA dioxygenase family)